MNDVEERWRAAARGTLNRRPTITREGIRFGCGTLLMRCPAGPKNLAVAEVTRAMHLLASARSLRHPTRVADGLRKVMADCANGDLCLAQIRLSQMDIDAIDDLDDAHRLFRAAALLDADAAPQTTDRPIGTQKPPPVHIEKYDPEEPRNPVGSGSVGGRWTKSPAVSGVSASPSTSARMLVPAAPSLVEALSSQAATWLARLAGRLALPAALFGAAVIPSPNEGTAEEGAVPDRQGLRYRLDRDTGELRLFDERDDDPTHALVTHLGADGIYRDVQTRVPIARAVGDSAVLIDLDRASAGADDAARDRDEPKLCPAPQPDRLGGRMKFDELYEQYVRGMVNPQRQPPLPPDLTFALPGGGPSGWVHYDDCRERDGAMIEAKGNYASLWRSRLAKEGSKGNGSTKPAARSRRPATVALNGTFTIPKRPSSPEDCSGQKSLAALASMCCPIPAACPSSIRGFADAAA